MSMEQNQLTRDLYAAGYTREDHPSFVYWSDWQNFGYLFEALLKFTWETPCGLLVDGKSDLGRGLACSDASFQGIDYCPENDNPLLRCPYERKDCPHSISGFPVPLCPCHTTGKRYSYEQSAERVESERSERQHRQYMEITGGAYCACVVGGNGYDGGHVEVQYDVEQCIRCRCQNPVCVIRKQKRDLSRANIFYDVRRTWITRIGFVGCNSSGASLALASVCEEYKVPSVATCATNSKVTEDDNGNVREWTFRVCLADPALGNVMAKYAYDELGLRRIGILKEISSDYSVGISDNFSDTFTSLGGEIVGVESYTAGDVDFRAQMTALHQKTPDALFLPMTYKELALATVQARDLGMDELFLGPDCWMAEDIFDLAGSAITGSYFVCTVDGNDSQLDSFKAMYEEAYHEPCDGAGQNAYFAYDAFVVIKQAVESAGSTAPKDIRDALETVENAQGLTTPITIRKDHKVIRSAIIFRVDAEKFEAIDTYMVDYGD